jgi:hypothetical protein
MHLKGIILCTYRLYSNILWYGPVAAVVSAVMNIRWSRRVGNIFTSGAQNSLFVRTRLLAVVVMTNRFALWDTQKEKLISLGNITFIGGFFLSRIKYLHYYLILSSFIRFLLCLFVLLINLLHFEMAVYTSWELAVCCQFIFPFHLSLFVYEFNLTWLLVPGFSNVTQKLNSLIFIQRWHITVVFSVIQNAFYNPVIHNALCKIKTATRFEYN